MSFGCQEDSQLIHVAFMHPLHHLPPSYAPSAVLFWRENGENTCALASTNTGPCSAQSLMPPSSQASGK